MRALLDVNALIALLDPQHVDHIRARTWLRDEVEHGWASCALTQNGFVRVLSQPRYTNPVPTSRAVDLLTTATATAHHEFWASTVRICDDDVIDRTRVLGPKQVTDVYLLALAVANGGRLATIDRNVPLDAVRGARPEHLTVL